MMVKTFEGQLTANNLKFGIVVARFNEFITNKLLGGSLDALTRHGAAEENIDVAWVPGAFEIPLAAQKMAASAEVSKGVAQISLKTNIPTIFGVLTTETIEQAIERAGTKAGNKGFDAAVSAIEMANLLQNM